MAWLIAVQLFKFSESIPAILAEMMLSVSHVSSTAYDVLTLVLFFFSMCGAGLYHGEYSTLASRLVFLVP